MRRSGTLPHMNESERDSTPSGFQAGTVLDARYRLAQLVGQTPVVESYFATHLQLGRSVCIDVLADLSLAQRFLRAGRRLAQLRHPNLAAVHDFGDVGGRPYVVLEDVGTTTLGDQLRVHGSLGIERTFEVAEQLLSALGYLHDKNLRHGAITADTAFGLGQDVKLARFAYVDPPDLTSGQLSKAAHRTLLDTLAFTAPERLLGDHVDARSDLYSTGCVLYQLLSGSSPFVGKDFGEVGRAVVASAPRSLLDFETDVSPELDRAIRKALEKDPNRRYANAAEMWDAIRASVDAETLRPPR